jgi:hypothetical protein
MARLYYPKENYRGGGNARDYGERVIKLIPTEVITAFMVFISVLDLHPAIGHYLVKAGVYAMMLTFIPIYYAYLNRTERKPIRNHIIVSCLSFLVWSYSIAGLKVFGIEYFHEGVAISALVFFTVFTPFVSYHK